MEAESGACWLSWQQGPKEFAFEFASGFVPESPKPPAAIRHPAIPSLVIAKPVFPCGPLCGQV